MDQSLGFKSTHGSAPCSRHSAAEIAKSTIGEAGREQELRPVRYDEFSLDGGQSATPEAVHGGIDAMQVEVYEVMRFFRHGNVTNCPADCAVERVHIA